MLLITFFFNIIFFGEILKWSLRNIQNMYWYFIEKMIKKHSFKFFLFVKSYFSDVELAK